MYNNDTEPFLRETDSHLADFIYFCIYRYKNLAIC